MDVNSISRSLLFSTVRIEADSPGGVSSGTGFLVRDVRGEYEALTLVTNKHVVEDATEGRFFFTRSDGQRPLLGQRVDVAWRAADVQWRFHPDPAIDVCSLGIGQVLRDAREQGSPIFMRSISTKMMPTDSEIIQLDAIEEILFIGYPNGIYDTVNLLPIARTGTTATPVQLDYCGRPVFLIDASVFPGSSGSPVFAYPVRDIVIRRRDTRVGALFLGLISQVLVRHQNNFVEFVEIPTLQFPLVHTVDMLDLGVVIKARAVREMLDFSALEEGIEVEQAE